MITDLIGCYQFLPNQSYDKPKLRLAKIKAAKVRAKKYKRAFEWLPKSKLANFLFYIQFKTFWRLAKTYDHKYWCTNSLTMNQLMTINFWYARVLAG
jgi:hypothetical protein